MRRWLAMLPITLAATVASASVDAARWHDRLLVVFAPRPTSPLLADQRREVDPAACAERDVKLIAVVGDRVGGASDAAAALRARFHVEPDAFRVVLVGKDGHVALTSPTPVTAARLAATIDAMPMRRDEMRRRKGS